MLATGGPRHVSFFASPATSVQPTRFRAGLRVGTAYGVSCIRKDRNEEEERFALPSGLGRGSTPFGIVVFISVAGRPSRGDSSHAPNLLLLSLDARLQAVHEAGKLPRSIDTKKVARHSKCGYTPASRKIHVRR